VADLKINHLGQDKDILEKLQQQQRQQQQQQQQQQQIKRGGKGSPSK